MQSFDDWIGRQEATEDEISLTLARRCAAMENQDPMSYRRGDELPPHWYSMFFTPNAAQDKIGHDGHPRKGDFLPPIPLPRRMFVGREVEFMRPLVIGQEARKVSEIASITPKEGRSGKLVFVQVRHTIYTDGTPAQVEKQNVVYREAARPGAPGQASNQASAAEPAFDWSEPLTIDPVHLFRYSALTWNGHRVHYDADYARDEEGYPACLMNGALTLHLLIGAALRRSDGRRLRHLSARMLSPLFVGETMTLAGTRPGSSPEGDIIDAAALAPSGRTSAEIRLAFAPREA